MEKGGLITSSASGSISKTVRGAGRGLKGLFDHETCVEFLAFLDQLPTFKSQELSNESLNFLSEVRGSI